MRNAVAAAPGPAAEALRLAYLDLLKLALCDLTGSSTHEVTSDRRKRVFSRELDGEEQLRWRIEGRDWPLNGLSMVGLYRLDDLQTCVETIVRDNVPGDLIEAGAWRGGASIFIRATLDGLGAEGRTLWVADSFQGFPRPADGDVAADQILESHMDEIEFPAPTYEAVRSYFARFGLERGMNLVPGFFEDTMGALRGRRWSLLRLDADTYKATKLLLETLYPGLEAGGYVILDDYFHPFLSDACRKAVDDFRSEHGITERIEQVDYTGARWRRETGAAPLAGEPPPAPAPPAPALRNRVAPRIPTDHEMQVDDELSAALGRLRSAEASLSSLRASPLAGPQAWLSRRGVR